LEAEDYGVVLRARPMREAPGVYVLEGHFPQGS